MSAVRAGSKDLRALSRDLRKGLSLEPDGKAKVRIIETATGLPLRYPDGRVVGMPNSPCAHTVADLRKRLRRVGALRTR